MRLPTPSTAHISPSDFEKLGIYEPSEDSYLLLDTLSSDAERLWLHERFNGTATLASTSISTPADGGAAVPSHPASRPHRTSTTARRLNGTTTSRIHPTPLVLEVGTGSGILVAFLTAHAECILGRRDVLTLAVDVNANAVREARKTVESAVLNQLASTAAADGGANGDGNGQLRVRATKAAIEGQDAGEREGRSGGGTATFLDALVSDLTTALKPGSVDVLIFNPPYVPTETLPSPHIPPTSSKFDTESQLLALAYAGGEDGMQITNRLLGELDEVLSERGVAYVLLCARNKPASVMEELRGRGWGVVVAGESGGKGGWERLSILRIYRQCNATTSNGT